ncbi:MULTISPECIES: DUF4941 domain-containing protein [Pseudothermotoga]|uniref:DUF4941 domain-containing protein n=1 Tax=Pseudothermotoga TaxID=1643951 RepID=UPI0003F687C3|nr:MULTISPECIES: DUF4941 domain-containing protein [Pseudothermotoga]KUK20797.1 MAG: Uncharacterized protein XD56_1294 [Pseudothermotoga lettingae]MDI3494299.1 hypothetical protein [Pseudothermotoga sp.]MDK2884088.1 hypothetical protein [Pseudothermotoga sp.]HBT25648.1 DUF4941 domain-containing protein [Pseudothermotoga sp.]
MRKLSFFLAFIAFSLCFSIEIYVGTNMIYSSPAENFTVDWNTFATIWENYCKLMGLEEPATGEIGDFSYFVWKGHTAGFSRQASTFFIDGVAKKSDKIPLKDTLDTFDIPAMIENNRLILPQMIVEDMKFDENMIEVVYKGRNELIFSEHDGQITVSSVNYVSYRGLLYKPGQMIAAFDTPQRKIDQLIELKGLIRVILYSKELIPGNVVLIPFFSEHKVDQNGILLFYAEGDGRIIIRPYSPDFEGSDWAVYAQTKEIAEKIANHFGLKIEICPIYDIPVGKIGMILLLNNQDIEQVRKFVEEMLE